MRALLAVVASVIGFGALAAPAAAAPPEPPPEAEAWPVDALVVQYTFADLYVGGERGGSYSVTIGRVGDGQPSVEVTRVSDDEGAEPPSGTTPIEPEVFDEVLGRLIEADLGDVDDPGCTDSPYHRLTVSYGGSVVADVNVTACGDESDDGIELLRSIIEPALDAIAE